MTISARLSPLLLLTAFLTIVLTALTLTGPAPAQDTGSGTQTGSETGPETAPAPGTTGSTTVAGGGDTPVAVIGPETITAEMLERTFAARGAQFGDNPEEAREALLNVLATELWVQQNFATRVRTNPAIREGLSEAERQILFDLYAQSTFTPTPPTEAEIDAYIAEHPEFFSERVDYRYQRFLIPTGPDTGPEAPATDALLDGLTATPEATSALATALAEAGLRFERSSVWTGSESIDADVLTRLESLAASDEAIDIVTRPGISSEITDVLILFAARPDPVDPSFLRESIAARLLQAQYVDHRNDLAAEIAAPLREAAVTGTAPPLGERMMAALGGLGAALGLALAAAFTWHRRTRQLFRLARLDNSDDALALLQRAGVVLVLALLFAAITTAAALFALTTRPAALVSYHGPAIVAGLTVLGLVFGLLVGAGRPTELAAARRRQLRSGLMATLMLTVSLGVAAVFAFFPELYLFS